MRCGGRWTGRGRCPQAPGAGCRGGQEGFDHDIHPYDAPPIAEQGLDATIRYVDIAPDAPHALPTHIFTRMGHWEASIESNARAAEASGDSDGAARHYGALLELLSGRTKVAPISWRPGRGRR